MKLYRNLANGRFGDVTAEVGLDKLFMPMGANFGDLDNDGDQEIVAEFGGAVPGDSHALRLFENPGHGNDWIGVKLVGQKSNRSAVAARIAVRIETRDGTTRAIHRTVGSGGSFGASPMEQHIGLGPSARIVELEIWWPTTDTRQRFTDLETNQVVEIAELADDYRRIERRPVRLGGQKPAK